MMNLKDFFLIAINASIKGGQAIMDVYSSHFEVEHKKDDSPLTLADKNCNIVIENFLQQTGVPILSEEGSEIPYLERRNWEYFWLIDPLDGTKEFVKRNGEFTVNNAMIHNGKPIIGVIYVPVKKELYFAMEGLGSFKIVANSLVKNLNKLIKDADKLPIDYTTMNPAKDLKINPIFCALNGGEDYELLFTISQKHYEKLKKDIDFTIIGHVTDKSEGNNFITNDASSHPITAQGWDPIKKD